MTEAHTKDSAGASQRLNGGHWRPHSCNDFQSETRRLSPVEYTAYSRLIDHAWPAGGCLPLDEDELRRMAGLSKCEWKRARMRVLSFFEKREDGYHHAQLDEELVKADARINAARKNGEASAAARKKKPPDIQPLEKTDNDGNGRCLPVATDEERRGDSSPSPLPAKEERAIASQSAPDGAAVTRLPVRDELWKQGVQLIGNATGKPDSAARSMLGRFVREAKDDCGLVLAVLREAADLRPVGSYVGWVNKAIEARLKPQDRDGFMVLAQQRRAAEGAGERYEPTPNPVQALLANEAAEAERRNARG